MRGEERENMEEGEGGRGEGESKERGRGSEGGRRGRDLEGEGRTERVLKREHRLRGPLKETLLFKNTTRKLNHYRIHVGPCYWKYTFTNNQITRALLIAFQHYGRMLF